MLGQHSIEVVKVTVVEGHHLRMRNIGSDNDTVVRQFVHERHTRVSRIASTCWSMVFAIAHTLTKESRASAGTSVERSTSRSPSSLIQILFQGSGLGAGPSIFVPLC